MNKQDCIFCKIVSGQISSINVFENDHVLAFLDVGPVSEGHTLVIPKQHYDRVEHTSPEVMVQVSKVLPMLAMAVQKAVNAEGCNVLCNNGPAAGQIVEHLHFHIIPRRANDGVFNRWPSGHYEDNRAVQIAEKIKQNLSL